jgi:hypothetical protein
MRSPEFEQYLEYHNELISLFVEYYNSHLNFIKGSMYVEKSRAVRNPLKKMIILEKKMRLLVGDIYTIELKGRDGLQERKRKAKERSKNSRPPIPKKRVNKNIDEKGDK